MSRSTSTLLSVLVASSCAQQSHPRARVSLWSSSRIGLSLECMPRRTRHPAPQPPKRLDESLRIFLCAERVPSEGEDSTVRVELEDGTTTRATWTNGLWWGDGR